jgi:heme oxygenase|tara:strand:- start:784 stop:1365 length:582 start_codon:yes stop_codon:yes gene_type:complete
MLDIKELTWEYHKNAERQKFVGLMMSGNIDKELYATYLYNQLQCYAVLEKYGMHNSLFRDTPDLLRAEHIHNDYRSLWTDIGAPPEITKSTKEYVEHIEKIQDEAMKLYAHIYVRHMGDLSGGQMIMKKTPGPNRYYKFKHKQVGDYRRIVKETINTYLNVYEHSVVPEAIFCFESAAKLFGEMYELYESSYK